MHVYKKQDEGQHKHSFNKIKKQHRGIANKKQKTLFKLKLIFHVFRQ